MVNPKLNRSRAVAALALLAVLAAVLCYSWSGETPMEEDLAAELFDRQLDERPTALDRLAEKLVQKHHVAPGTPQFDKRLKKMLSTQDRVFERIRTAEGARIRKDLKDREEVWLRRTTNEAQDSNVVATTEAYFKEQQRLDVDHHDPLTVCGRPADVPLVEDSSHLQKYALCPEITQDKPILLLERTKKRLEYGRTGNKIIEFFHAIQEAHDQDMQLVIRTNSWIMKPLTQMFFPIKAGQLVEDWSAEFERAFCVKLFSKTTSLEGHQVHRSTTRNLFFYHMAASLGEVMDRQGYLLRTFFRNYSTGQSGEHDMGGTRTEDMCSGMDAVLGAERASAVYSVIHSRTLENDGHKILARVAAVSGCDKDATLEMRPEYVKSILKPLGMMDHPIVLITDGQNPKVLERLMADPEIGPLMRLVPKEASWIGGDITLALMSNVFIGNPASTFSGFVARARLALGFGHSHLFRAKDENGEWRTVCGDHCAYDPTIMGAMTRR